MKFYKRKFDRLISFYCGIVHLAQNYLGPLLDLFIRLWMARIFFKSGLVKIASWSATVALFRHEYKTPFLTPEFAAFSSTAIELTAPVLLTIGLATRLAAIPMLIMALVIQFTYLDFIEHYYWMMLLGIIITKGPGPISLDYWIAKRWCK